MAERNPADALMANGPWSCARPLRGALAVAALLVAATGCEQSPQEFVLAFETALASGDAERVAPLLTAESRPVFRALVATGGASDALKDPFKPRKPQQSARVGRVVPIDDGVMIDVHIGEQRREWLLTRVGGRYRLDLLATATRRPWGGL